MARLFKSLEQIPDALLPTHLRGQGKRTLAPPPSVRKYRNEPTEACGTKFPSKRQARRWQELLLLQAAGEIKHLMPEVSFPIGGGRRMRIDAHYVRTATGESVWEDTKGYVTSEWKLKRDIAERLYGITIALV
jgi:hypothetical protein